MGLFTKDIHTFEDLFEHTLKDIYYAENQIVKALPTMIEKATRVELKNGFKKHLEETKTHVTRLERSDAACDRMPHTLRHSECQVGGRSGDKDASPYSSRQSTKEWSSSLSSLNVA